VILAAGAAPGTSQAVAQVLETGLQAHVYASETLPDDRRRIAARVRHYIAGHSIDVVLVLGGTGFVPDPRGARILGLPASEAGAVERLLESVPALRRCMARGEPAA